MDVAYTISNIIFGLKNIYDKKIINSLFYDIVSLYTLLRYKINKNRHIIFKILGKNSKCYYFKILFNLLNNKITNIFI